MAEYVQIEKPFLGQLGAPGWIVEEQRRGIIPSDPAKSLHTNFRELSHCERIRVSVPTSTPRLGDAYRLNDREISDLRGSLCSRAVDNRRPG